MNLTRLIGCALAVATLAACAKNDLPEPTESVVKSELRSEPRRVGQRSSDGESVSVEQLEMAPTIDVEAGGVCGARDAAGNLLSCVPGTYCLRSSAAAARCVSASPAPPNE
jgi:hypothetical protein